MLTHHDMAKRTLVCAFLGSAGICFIAGAIATWTQRPPLDIALLALVAGWNAYLGWRTLTER